MFNIESDVLDDLYKAVGMVTVQWSLLETVTDHQIAVTADICGVELPAEFWRKEFKHRLSGWAEMLENKYPHQGLRDSGLDLISKIKSLSGQRHRISHRNWQPATPGSNRVSVVLASNKHRKEYEWKTSPEKVREIAQKIFRLTIDVMTIGQEYDIAVNTLPHKSHSPDHND